MYVFDSDGNQGRDISAQSQPKFLNTTNRLATRLPHIFTEKPHPAKLERSSSKICDMISEVILGKFSELICD